MENLVVRVLDGNVEGALRRVKKLVGYTGLFKEMKRHQERTKPGEAKMAKSLRARRRERRAAVKLQQHDTAYVERGGR